jgi:hypothetical protein
VRRRERQTGVQGDSGRIAGGIANPMSPSIRVYFAPHRWGLMLYCLIGKKEANTGFHNSRMSGDVQVRFRERLGGRFPGATRQGHIPQSYPHFSRGFR